LAQAIQLHRRFILLKMSVPQPGKGFIDKKIGFLTRLRKPIIATNPKPYQGSVLRIDSLPGSLILLNQSPDEIIQGNIPRWGRM
jgi:hypothetical protein